MIRPAMLELVLSSQTKLTTPLDIAAIQGDL